MTWKDVGVGLAWAAIIQGKKVREKRLLGTKMPGKVL